MGLVAHSFFSLPPFHIIAEILLHNFVDVPGGHQLPGYFARGDERAAHREIRDADSIGASYDRYLRSAVYLLYSCSNLSANFIML